MARVFISMSGEGRGHATRVRAVTEALRGEHDICLFAPGDAHQLLAPLYEGTDVAVESIPGLRFHYRGGRRVDYSRTGREALRYLIGLPRLLRRLEARIRDERPGLIITDFEPALPRAARRAGVPFVSLDHQHFLLTYDLSSLPRRLRWHAAYMAAVVRVYCSGQAESIVSSFYFPPLRTEAHHVTQIGVLLRPEVVAARPRHGDHLVSYWRRFAPENVLQALRDCGREVRVYGLGERPSEGNLTFRPISADGFLTDLAGCSALVCTAGNQLVGEALHLGKPVLAAPEPGNYEQYINAHFLGQSGAGDWAEMAAFDGGLLQAFLKNLEQHRRRIPRDRMNGLPEALRLLRRQLAKRADPAGVPKLQPA